MCNGSYGAMTRGESGMYGPSAKALSGVVRHTLLGWGGFCVNM